MLPSLVPPLPQDGPCLAELPGPLLVPQVLGPFLPQASQEGGGGGVLGTKNIVTPNPTHRWAEPRTPSLQSHCIKREQPSAQRVGVITIPGSLNVLLTGSFCVAVSE